MTLGEFYSGRFARPIALAFLIAFFNQLSGINAVLYFAPRIFEMTGIGRAARSCSVGIGVTNLIFTIRRRAPDRPARAGRTLLSSARSATSCRWASSRGRSPASTTPIVPVCIFVFIAAHAIGQGTVIWVFISEIFPNRLARAGRRWAASRTGSWRRR